MATIKVLSRARVEHNADAEPRHPEPGKENYIVIDHGDGTYGRYYHLTTDGSDVEPGEAIRGGQKIGRSGNSGASFGPHLHESIQSARDAYREFNHSNPDDQTENEVNSLAWTYLNREEHEKAIMLFELNAQSHTDSWMAFNSLGAAYMRTGKREQAIEALERSLELNPKNARARVRLEELRAE